MAAVTTNGSEAILDFTTFKNTINNELVDTVKHRYGINPATQERLPNVPIATKGDLDNTVKAAHTAFKKWRDVPRVERNAAVLKFADLIEANAKGFTTLLTTEQGKPTPQATFEIGGCVAWLRAMSKIKVDDEVFEDTAERKVVTRFTPLGVVGAIVPWNFPCLLNIGKIGPAVLMGNTIIVKPSPFTPYTALKFAELASQCFPPGVVQALSGDDDLGPWMTAIEGIDKISFTGSTVTGKKVARSAAATMKRLTLELGGKDPAIICASVDIPKVAAEVCTYAFLNSGQICLAIKRVYIHSSIYAAFRDAMVKYIKTLKIGHGLNDNIFFGPIQNEMQYKKVRSLFDDIEKEKWNVAVGGTVDTNVTGYFINPTIIDNPADDSRIVTEEPFGPILPILSWDTEEEVIKRANASELGLGASVWSNDMEQAERIGSRIEAGTVWVNTHFDVSPVIPFGGHKQSGLGVEWGVAGMKGMCNQQTLNIHKIK